jgi:hypothetical protein
MAAREVKITLRLDQVKEDTSEEIDNADCQRGKEKIHPMPSSNRVTEGAGHVLRVCPARRHRPQERPSPMSSPCVAFCLNTGKHWHLVMAWATPQISHFTEARKPEPLFDGGRIRGRPCTAAASPRSTSPGVNWGLIESGAVDPDDVAESRPLLLVIGGT